MPKTYQPQEPLGSKTYNFSVFKDQKHLIDFLGSIRKRGKSAAIREALECFLIVYDLYGEDWRLRLHELKRPLWLDEVFNRMDNLTIPIIEDNNIEGDTEIEIVGDMFYEA